ncbi:hypothetical protein HJFPF1_00814 [Paramyrothecium foliicola]|nr:hypothetical protein HJFPF1_00814 [Paramyrothecium foliicola]
MAVLVRALLPAEVADYINTHVLHPDSPVQILSRRASLEADRAFRAVYPLLRPTIDKLTTMAAESEGLVSAVVAVTLVTTVVMLMIWVQRLAMWFTRMAMRLTFWGLLVLVGAAIWQRGVFESARDAAVVVGKIVGYLAVLKDIWLEEYDRYESQQMSGSGRRRSSRR